MTNAYDSLTRLSSLTYKTDDDHNDVKAAYGYVDWSADANRTTSTVRGIDYTFNTGLLSVSDLYYTYDKSGNITAERVWTTDDSKPLREKYTYDQKNQLTRHDSKTQNASFVYTYGQAGNILSVKRYAYTTGTLGDVLETKTYTYGDSTWADLLTKYNGKAITYDGIGNMTSYNGSTYTWQGRELRKITNGSNTYSYKYNADGIRTSKTVNGTTTEFFLNGSQILALKVGDGVMRFFYDSTGKRVGFSNGNTLYYYLYNLQGDVIAIVRATTGQVVAKYSYDAWGKCTVTNAAGYTVGDKNPFRYRGYYYDTETGLYYLNSRYYNPEFGRFISVDGFVSTGQGITGSNMFAYCGNNPINRYDPSGNSFLGIAAGAVILKYLAAIAASVLLLIGFNSIVNNPPASPPITIPKFEFKSESTENTEEKDKPAAIPSQPNTTIYRYGGTNPGNLTPREKDKYTGLSFSTIPLPGAAETTIEALNSTGVVYAIRDGKTHVSVRPVGGSMQDWIDAGSASIWTQAVKSVVVKWDGVN